MAGGKRRTGPLFCLQRTSRAADGTPLHIRMDGPGFDAMAVPGGASVPKLQFTIFRADAEFFRTLRTSQASLDLQNKYSVSVEDNGLERFLTPPGGRTSRFPAPSPSPKLRAPADANADSDLGKRWVGPVGVLATCRCPARHPTVR